MLLDMFNVKFARRKVETIDLSQNQLVHLARTSFPLDWKGKPGGNHGFPWFSMVFPIKWAGGSCKFSLKKAIQRTLFAMDNHHFS